MKQLIFSLCLVGIVGGLLPLKAHALDYQIELDYIQTVEDMRGKGFTREKAERLAIVATARYYATSPKGRRPDKLIYALDEFYHERLGEILDTYASDIPDVNLEEPDDDGIARIGIYLVKIAHLF